MAFNKLPFYTSNDRKKLSHPFINSNPKWSRKCMHPRPAVKGWIFLLKLMITFKSAGSTYFIIKKEFFRAQVSIVLSWSFYKNSSSCNLIKKKALFIRLSEEANKNNNDKVPGVICLLLQAITIYHLQMLLTINNK